MPLNDRLSKDSPFTQPPVVGIYPPRPYWFRGIPYFEETKVPNDWHATLPDGTVLKGVSGAEIERQLKIVFFATPVLVFPDGAVSINGVTTRKVTNLKIDSDLQGGAGSEGGEPGDNSQLGTQLGQWYPLDPSVVPLYKAAVDKATPAFRDNWTGEIFA